MTLSLTETLFRDSIFKVSLRGTKRRSNPVVRDCFASLAMTLIRTAMIRDKEQPKPSTSSALSKPPLTAEGNSEIKGSKVLAQETQTTYPSDIRLWSDIWAGNGGVNSVFGEKGYPEAILSFLFDWAKYLLLGDKEYRLVDLGAGNMYIANKLMLELTRHFLSAKITAIDYAGNIDAGNPGNSPNIRFLRSSIEAFEIKEEFDIGIMSDMSKL